MTGPSGATPTAPRRFRSGLIAAVGVRNWIDHRTVWPAIGLSAPASAVRLNRRTLSERGTRPSFLLSLREGQPPLDAALLVLLVRSSYPVAALEDYRFDGTGRLLLRKRPPPGGPAGWRVARRPTPANDRPCLPLAVSILAQFSVTRVCEVGSAHRCEPGISSIRIDRAREIGALRLGWEPGSEFVRGWLVVPDETAR